MTESQSATQRDRTRPLTPSQCLALDALEAGWSHVEAAIAAGVCRSSVSRWASQHEGFKLELARRLDERAKRHAARLDALTDRALDQVESAIEAGDSAASMSWLRLVGADALRARSAEPDAADRAAEEERKVRERSAKLWHALQKDPDLIDVAERLAAIGIADDRATQ